MQSEVIRCNQRSSEAILIAHAQAMQSEVIRCNQRSSDAIRGRRRPSS
jgi:hypothetical protein